MAVDATSDLVSLRMAEAEGKRAEEAIASKSASAGSVGCLSHSAKQWSVFKHSNKKLNYFLIEFLMQ